MRERLSISVCLLALIGSTPAVSAAENSALKAEISSSLNGAVMVSKVTLGGRAIATGYETDWPVITIANTETGAVTYRVESGFVRFDVRPREMRRYFAQGSSFHVSSIDLKDEGLELKLESESESGDSAKLRLLLGQGWQSRLSVEQVMSELARVFQLPDSQNGVTPPPSQSASPQGPLVSSASVPVTSQSNSASTVTFTASKPASSPSSPRQSAPSYPSSSVRLRPAEFSAILAEAENARLEAAQGTTPDCKDIIASVAACEQILQTETPCGLLRRAGRPICAESLRISVMEGGLKSIERSLDNKDAIAALAYYEAVRGGASEVVSLSAAGRLTSQYSGGALQYGTRVVSPEDVPTPTSQSQGGSPATTLPFVDEYLERTRELYSDLREYREATLRLGNPQTATIADVVNVLYTAVTFQQSRASQLGDTRGLQSTIAAQSASLQQRLESLPDFQLDASKYALPASSENSYSALQKKSELLASWIAEIEAGYKPFNNIGDIDLNKLNYISSFLRPGESQRISTTLAHMRQVSTAYDALRAAQEQTTKEVEATAEALAIADLKQTWGLYNQHAPCSTSDAYMQTAIENISMGKRDTECIILSDYKGNIEKVIVVTRIPYMQEYRELITKYGAPLPGRYALVDGDAPDSSNAWQTKGGTKIAERQGAMKMRGTVEDAYRGQVIPYTLVLFIRGD